MAGRQENSGGRAKWDQVKGQKELKEKKEEGAKSTGYTVMSSDAGAQEASVINSASHSESLTYNLSRNLYTIDLNRNAQPELYDQRRKGQAYIGELAIDTSVLASIAEQASEQSIRKGQHADQIGDQKHQVHTGHIRNPGKVLTKSILQKN